VIAAAGSLLLGIFAHAPVALAPGIGLIYFVVAFCASPGGSWQAALAAVIVAGALFFFVTCLKIRERLLRDIPYSLQLAISAGIGLFLARIALESINVPFSKGSAATLGSLHSLETWLVIGGFALILVMRFFWMSGAIIASILFITLCAEIRMPAEEARAWLAWPPAMTPVFSELDFAGLWSFEKIGVVFAIFLMTLFDSAGVLMGVTHSAGLWREGTLPRFREAMLVTSTAVMAGGCLGTTPSVVYIESAAGVSAGGRTGITAIVIGLLFIASLFCLPMLARIPHYAVAPAMLYVAMMMMQGLVRIDHSDFTESLPAYLTVMAIPFSHSIANGIALGFISYVLARLVTGAVRAIPGILWLIAGLWSLKFLLWGF
jgi:AGZA family xanthine/uracil permease-like MFS transporter